jgi:hypothetical protein
VTSGPASSLSAWPTVRYGGVRAAAACGASARRAAARDGAPARKRKQAQASPAIRAARNPAVMGSRERHGNS